MGLHILFPEADNISIGYSSFRQDLLLVSALSRLYFPRWLGLVTTG